MEKDIISSLKRIFNKTKEFINDKRKIIIIILSLIAFICLFNICKPIGKKELLNKIQISFENGKVDLACKYMKIDGEKVSKKSLEPLLKYYASNNSEVESVIYNLKRYGKSGNFTVDSKKTFLGQQYYINVNKVKIKFLPTTNNTSLYLNGEEIEADNYSEIIPGRYTIRCVLNTEYGNIDEEKQIDLLIDKEEKIEVSAKYITLYSNFEDAKVFINGKDINKTVSEVKGYGPIPNDKDILLHIEREFPWGNVKSAEVNLKNQNIIKIDIDMANTKLILNIQNTLNEFCDSLFKALSEKDSSLITKVEESSREQIFDYLYIKTALFSNNYTISDLNLKIENSEFMMEDEKYRANVLIEMNYSVAKKILPFIKKDNTGSFLVGLIYEDNNWIVDSCQKIKFDLEVE